MPDSFLRLRFVNDGDGTGELIAVANSCNFSGAGRAYFNVEAIEEFANAIADFSVSNELHTIAGGFIGTDGRPGELDEEHLGISAYPINSRGHIGVQVRMATPIHPGDRPESRQSATIELVTTHAPLAAFSRHLIAVLRGDAEEAVLIGSE